MVVFQYTNISVARMPAAKDCSSPGCRVLRRTEETSCQKERTAEEQDRHEAERIEQVGQIRDPVGDAVCHAWKAGEDVAQEVAVKNFSCLAFFPASRYVPSHTRAVP